MKKILFFSLLIVSLLFVTGCNKEKLPEEVANVGGWKINDELPLTTIPKDAVDAFNAAAEKYTDMVLKPVDLLGTQVVSGTNYMFLCKGTKDSKSSYNVVIVYKDLKNKSEITKVSEFKLEDYVSKDIESKQEELFGGWTIFTDVGESRLNEEEQEIFDAVKEKLLGVNYKPVANLGTQLVAGTNYAFLVVGQTVTEKPVSTVSIFTIYVNLKGEKELTSIANINLADFNK